MLEHTPVQAFSPVKHTDGSDGENVINDEQEDQSNAFEARVSQWNRKLSIKQHSDEREIDNGKVDLARSIVVAFENARSTKVRASISNKEGDSNEPDMVEDEELP